MFFYTYIFTTLIVFEIFTRMILSKNLSENVLIWCRNTLGCSRFKKTFPKLCFHNKITKEDIYGQYDYKSNKIHIYGPKHDTVLDLIDTIIHEYWHYKQNLKMYNNYFFKYGRNEDNHPYEKSAISKAKKFKKRCYNELFN